MPAREAWGLDIGQTAVHAVRLQRKGAKVEITDQFFHPLQTQIDDPAYEDKVEEALELFIEEKEVGKTPVVASLPGFTTLFRDFSIPPAKGSRLREYVSYEAKQQIPYPLDEVVWDFHCMREDESLGDLGIAVVCCRRDIVSNFLAICDRTGLNIDALQVGPIALTNYVLYDTPPEGAALILDAGARGTDFIVVNEGSFWLRSIGVSGTDLSRALMNKFSIPFAEAEKLKQSMGEGKQGERVFKVVEPIIRNLCGEVQRSLGFYKSNNRGVEIREIVCAGGTFMLPGMDQCVADNLAIPTRTLTLPEEIGMGAGGDEAELELNRQVAGTAIGCALQGVGLAEIVMSLMPQERRMARLIKEKQKYGYAGVALAGLAVALNFLYSDSRAEQYADLVARIGTAQSSAKEANQKFEDSRKAFAPEESRNRALANIAPTRGWLLESSGAVRSVIRDLNDKAARDYANVRESQLAADSKALYDEFITKRKSELGNIDKEQLEQLKAQIRYRVRLQTDRMGRVFLRDENYSVVKIREVVNKDTQERKWEVLYHPGGAAADKKNEQNRDGGFQPGGFQPGGFTPGGDQQQQEQQQDNFEAKEPVDAVEVTFSGFVVTSEKRDVLKIKDRLQTLAEVDKDTITRNFDMQSVGKTNTLMLPTIVVPKRIEQNTAAVGAEGGDQASHATAEEEGKYETYNGEKIIEFSAKFYYLPKEFHPVVTALPKAPAAGTEAGRSEGTAAN